MSPPTFSLLIFFSLFLVTHSQTPNPRAILLNCGAPNATSQINGQQWLSDSQFINLGTPLTLNLTVSSPTLSSLRFFPENGRKFCYTLPVFRTARYLVRTTYFYGNFDRQNSPPVFDQIIDGTLWSTVNTTQDYVNGLSSYYELIVEAAGKTLSVCLARNSKTVSSPFISSLELTLVENSVYNSTNFSKHALRTVARHSFGYSGPIIRSPGDRFGRFWEPFSDGNIAVNSTTNVSVAEFWNIPPSKVFETALTTNVTKAMELQWPTTVLPNSSYYVALYFANNRGSGSERQRVFNVSINGIPYSSGLNITSDDVVVYATQRALSGLTKISLTPLAGSTAGPLINAGELFSILVLGGRTLTRDVIALERVKASLQNPPVDWNGDPCLPLENSWTGIACSEGPRIRVTVLNLTGMGVSGSLSPSVGKLTALTDIWLGSNNLNGSIPDLSSLQMLQRLHFENNKLNGEIPATLGNITTLHEIFVQNNNLTGLVPSNLRNKPGLNLQVSPGNQFLASPPTPST